MVNFLHIHVSATFCGHPEENDKYMLQRNQKPVYKFKILSYKIYGLKHTLKYKIHIKLSVLNLSEKWGFHSLLCIVSPS